MHPLNLYGNELTLRVADSAAGVGSLISSGLCLYIMKKNRPTTKYLLISIILLAFSIGYFCFSKSLATAFGLYALVGIFIGNFKILIKTMIFSLIEKDYIGRTMMSVNMMSLCLSILYSFVIGKIAEWNLLCAYLLISTTLLIPFLMVYYGVQERKEKDITNYYTDIKN